MKYFLTVVFLLVAASLAFAGDYVTATKQPDGGYLLEFSSSGRFVLSEMEAKEGATSLERNTENLMRVWHRRIKESARVQAVEELRENGGVVTPKVKELLEKARR